MASKIQYTICPIQTFPVKNRNNSYFAMSNDVEVSFVTKSQPAESPIRNKQNETNQSIINFVTPSRPFLHEGNGNVTITPTQLDYRPKSASVVSKSFNPGSVRLHRILQREAAASAPAGQIQRRAAQRKLQMAKMLSNGGINAAALNFQRNHHEHQNQNDPLFVASRRARSNNFTLKETFDLLKIWASPEMQWQMKHNFRNFRVWEAISFAMHESGHDRTAIQCKNRIQNLTSIFYRIKKSKQDYRTFNFPYYKLIGDVLDGKKNGTSSSMNPSTAMSLSNSAFLKNNNSGVTISPSQNSTAGFAAHMALVEEYQHLINGNPEVYITPAGGHSSSNNSNSGLNVLSPEVSLSEGDSPIRVENQGSRNSANPQASSSKDTSTPKSSHNSNNNAAANRNGTSTGSLLKTEPSDSVTVTVTEDPNNSENDMKYENDNDLDNSDLDDSMLGALNDANSEGNDGFPAARTKRSFSANYAPYGKASFTAGLGNGNAAKRPRGASTATNASSNPDDQIGAYLAEMIDIERQWLDMERERAENERSMMMYMMQILQALVCPGQSTEDNDEESNENETDGIDGEGAENENEDDNENEENEIHQMIEQEENNIDDGDGEGEDADPDE